MTNNTMTSVAELVIQLYAIVKNTLKKTGIYPIPAWLKPCGY